MGTHDSSAVAHFSFCFYLSVWGYLSNELCIVFRPPELVFGQAFFLLVLYGSLGPPCQADSHHIQGLLEVGSRGDAAAHAQCVEVSACPSGAVLVADKPSGPEASHRGAEAGTQAFWW